MKQFFLKDKFHPSESIFEINNFYNIYFNSLLKGWLKFTYEDEYLVVIMIVDNIEGLIIWKCKIDDEPFLTLDLFCSSISGVYLDENVNQSKLYIKFKKKMNDLKEMEENLIDAFFYFHIIHYDDNIDALYTIANEEIHSIKVNETDESKRDNIINFNKINNIHEDNNKILNSKDFFMNLFKFINKPNKDDFNILLNYISSLITNDKNLEDNYSFIHLNFLKSFIKSFNQD
jgi:hypothetical protein